MNPSKLIVRATLFMLLVFAVPPGCGRETTSDSEAGGSAGRAGSDSRGGTGATTGGNGRGGASGSSTGGSATGGSATGGSATGGTGNAGAGGDGGSDAGSAGDDAGGGGGAEWGMIGGCPSQLCPNRGLPDGETCSVTVTCCEYQHLSEGVQGCTCTDGRWVCGVQRCACP